MAGVGAGSLDAATERIVHRMAPLASQDRPQVAVDIVVAVLVVQYTAAAAADQKKYRQWAEQEFALGREAQICNKGNNNC